MKRRKILAIISFILIFSCTGCAENGWYKLYYEPKIEAEYQQKINEKIINKEERFVYTGNTYKLADVTYSEYVDTETLNVYLCNKHQGLRNKGDMMPLLDENGDIEKWELK